ncbi:lysophospholipid acyltransferase family protein [Curvibacter sp. HBC61]|uniref:Lysophospholipid acyltransferase family protein n=1 Tax=Curvibacter cyanobacteriorum TaxID=3026422 RepID=A0ABT5N0A4_9BURK|nr:lysophospholipid acyltransferase family protein [Curvibacter sp. HBC61]MDD0839744.1 lysophospholipid acyltransferase family protein [Curvibacter sp. HBC61]
MSAPSRPPLRWARAPRAAWRLLRVLGQVLSGLATVLLRFPRLNEAERAQQVEQWSRQMLRVLGIELRVLGQPLAHGPALLVSNHISWLDILVLHASRHCRFVSKSEVRHWPLIGAMAAAAGTLFIERASRRDALRVVHDMHASLVAGDVLAVFPEGTTGDGLQVLPFHANLLQAAVSADAPVQPVALKFVEVASGARSLAPCYVGDDTLVGSLWRTLSSDPIAAVVQFGVPEHAHGRDRRAWALDLQQTVSELAA